MFREPILSSISRNVQQNSPEVAAALFTVKHHIMMGIKNTLTKSENKGLKLFHLF